MEKKKKKIKWLDRPPEEAEVEKESPQIVTTGKPERLTTQDLSPSLPYHGTEIVEKGEMILTKNLKDEKMKANKEKEKTRVVVREKVCPFNPKLSCSNCRLFQPFGGHNLCVFVRAAY